VDGRGACPDSVPCLPIAPGAPPPTPLCSASVEDARALSVRVVWALPVVVLVVLAGRRARGGAGSVPCRDHYWSRPKHGEDGDGTGCRFHFEVSAWRVVTTERRNSASAAGGLLTLGRRVWLVQASGV
jgi:hypothetical protein